VSSSRGVVSDDKEEGREEVASQPASYQTSLAGGWIGLLFRLATIVATL